MTDVQIDTDTEKVTLLKVAWIIDKVMEDLGVIIEDEPDDITATYLTIGMDTLEQLRSAMFKLFKYQEPGKQC